MRHIQPVERRAFYLALPPVTLEVQRGAAQACFEGEAFLADFSELNVRTHRDETDTLDEKDELVYPAHQEDLQVGGPQSHRMLFPLFLRRALEYRHEQRPPGLVEQGLKRRSPYLESDIRGVVQHPDHSLRVRVRYLLRVLWLTFVL